MNKSMKQLGQGMVEYLIIVGLIAIAAIAVYSFFGDTLRSQTSAMTQELSGQSGTAATTAAQASATQAAAEQDHKGLQNFTGAADK